ncbi:hypothetical protein GCM10010922_08180 [Microbacterium sorbitolivorans]|uniref:DUF5648 domain-containing protein n=1 Tax=Microbacterium sorbitolivorans TaxID=1867410 RepID=A0A367XXG5_9MICO|nr:hypothetical protein [Microbacterium sorbitolivorans]RCK58307.1 hypothetical protein DTO57_09005 [Microbacterium sorbitolivorans]GGF35397.1 hypothetical protein GCM10010922_08180 [Microbacterium sorbitolivorans]
MPRPTALRSKLALVLGVLALAAATLVPSAAVADDASEIPLPESGDYLGSTTLDEADPGEASATAETEAISLRNFDAGNLISDKQMYTSGTMTAKQIQSFLNAKVPTCQKGYTCLKNFTQKTVTKKANSYCSGTYTGSSKESAASIISKAAKACGVSEKVLLVMLQKEQGLVTHTWPSAFRYDKAMGFACPDNAACDPQFFGFQNQVYMAAQQLRRYSIDPYFSWYPVGKKSQVRYHPNAACGTAAVTIKNKATAALYYYTPYQPNKAALAAGYGTGDSCSSYGNRNFVNYYTDWFGGSGGGSTGPNAKDAKPVARFWSSKFDNAHFYTLNASEANTLKANDPNWAYEGTGFRAWATTNGSCRAGTIPVYRFWSSKFESHFYTTNSAEMQKVRDTDKNWAYEGTAFCTAAKSSSTTTPVYRFWSEKYGKHFYTSNAAESQNLRNNDPNWSYEGVALYAPK